MTDNQINIGTGYFLQFSEEESKKIDEFLKINDYPSGKEGIIELIMEVVSDDDPKEEKSNPILEAIKENPQAVSQGAKIIGDFLRKKFT
jgi:hypothetical protein